MNIFSTIDLTKLPSPKVVDDLRYEDVVLDLFNRFKTDLAVSDGLRNVIEEYQLLFRKKQSVNDLIIDYPILKVLEVLAFREFYLRKRLNYSASQVMLATASDKNLEAVTELFGVNREQQEDGFIESDDSLRYRTQLSLEGMNTSGTEGAYLFRSLFIKYQHETHIERVKDIHIESPNDEPGKVVITVLSDQDNGVPTQALLEAVRQGLNENVVRPVTDHLLVQAAKPIKFKVRANITIPEDIDAVLIRDDILKALATFNNENHQLGNEVTISGLYAVLHQPGVLRVELLDPLVDFQVAPDESLYAYI